MSAVTSVKKSGRFRLKDEHRAKVVLDLHFRVHRSGVFPAIEFVPGSGLDDVSELTKPERRELVRHVRSMLRDRWASGV